MKLEILVSLVKKNMSIVNIVLATMFVLMIPLVAMQFSDEVDWNLADFIVFGALLMGTGLVYELVARKLRSAKHRLILGSVLLVALVLIWAELAVGVFGTPFAGS